MGSGKGRAKRVANTATSNSLTEAEKNTPVFEVTGIGGSHGATFKQLAEHTIQDPALAIEIAEEMISDDYEYEWNADEPEFMETFEIINKDLLIKQMKDFLS